MSSPISLLTSLNSAIPPSPEFTKSVLKTVDPVMAEYLQKILSSIEEPNNKYDEDRVYVATNEANQRAVLATLKEMPLAGEVMLFVSGFFGLNAAAVRGKTAGQKIQFLICIDISYRVQLFWEEMVAIIKGSSSKDQVTNKVIALIQNKQQVFFNRDPNKYQLKALAKLDYEIKKGISWLSTDENFEVIKSLFDANHFIFKRLDVCDEKAMATLSRCISSQGLNLDCVYLSNIREYASHDKLLHAFHLGIKCLRNSISDQTLFIDTKPRSIEDIAANHLEQRVIYNVPSSNFDLTFPGLA
jgi:hypothetical protein